jgi:hypothetical protein
VTEAAQESDEVDISPKAATGESFSSTLRKGPALAGEVRRSIEKMLNIVYSI